MFKCCPRLPKIRICGVSVHGCECGHPIPSLGCRLNSLFPWNAEHSWQCRTSAGCSDTEIIPSCTEESWARCRKEGNLEKVPNHASPEAPNTSCSCENRSPNPPASLEEEGTSFLEITLHTACGHSVTSSLWTAAALQVSTELWYFWTDSGLSFQDLWQLKELDRKNGLTADEMWTWSACWNEHSLHSKAHKRIECCNDFLQVSVNRCIVNPSQNPSSEFIFTSPWKCLFLGRSNTLTPSN